MGEPSERAKGVAARAAALRARPGMLVALGTGSTASIAIAALGERFASGRGIDAVASSHASEELARRVGLTVRAPKEGDVYDLMIDGADEVSPSLDLTKGAGGALLREKLLARHAREFVIAVDPIKLVPRLGERSPIPVEIVPFARPLLLPRLRELGFAPALRTAPDGSPWVTENRNEILDLRTGPVPDPPALERQLRGLSGVIETGLFLGMAHRVIVGHDDGRVEERTAPAGMPGALPSRSPNP